MKLKLNYTFHDLRQTILGCLAGVFGLILFFVFGEPKQGAIISPVVGSILTVLILILIYFSVKKYCVKGALSHLLINYIVALIVAIGTTYMFGLTDLSLILSFNFLGSIPVIVSWIIFIPALIFDIQNFATFIDHDLGTYYLDRVTNRYNNSLSYYCSSKYKGGEDLKKCLNGETEK